MSDDAASFPQLAKPVRRVSLTKQVSDEVRQLILSGTIAVGEALPPDTTLSRMFGCSRGVVREALRGLEQMGLVQREPSGRRLIVGPVTLEKFSESFQLYVHLSDVTFKELFEFLEGMERWTASQAAAHRRPDALARMTSLHERQVTDLETLVEVEEDFHDQMAEATGNRLIVVSRKPLRAVLHDAIASMVPLMGRQAISGTLRAHEEILKAINAGDAAAAGDWAYRHAHGFREALSLLGRSESEPVRHLVPAYSMQAASETNPLQ